MRTVEDPAAADASVRTALARVRETVRSRPQPLRDLARKAKVSPRRTRAALRFMAENGEVRETKDGRWRKT